MSTPSIPVRFVATASLALLAPLAAAMTAAPTPDTPSVEAAARAHGHSHSVAHSHAAVQPGEVEIFVEALRGGVHMLTGQGGNIGVFTGADGTLMIDDQFAPLSPRIEREIRSLDDKPIKLLINTHYHFDHTGGNEHFGGRGAMIIAHRAVRERLATDQYNATFNRTTPATAPAGLPVVTFDDTITIHWNGDAVRLHHVPAAHTDGDAFVHFGRADVLHAGDLFFNGFYPFIDAAAGGTIDGTIAGVNRMLALSGSDTLIIPGHGPLARRADLVAYRDMLDAAATAIRPLVARGLDNEAIVAAKPTAALDGAWGDGFLEPGVWVALVADGMRNTSGD